MPEFRKTDTLFLRSLLLLFLSLFTSHLLADVGAILSQQTTGLDQPVQLTLQIKGDQELNPDLSLLEKDFEILSRSSQQSISVINGQMSAKRSLRLSLLPKRAGTLSIPAIPIGDETTLPLTLQVTEQPQDNAEKREKLARIELSLNKESAYLEEEILLTLKLYQAPGVRGESLEPPEASFDDTQMNLIHEDRYASQKDGIEYRVLERVYALFARQSGKLTLSGAKFRGQSGGNIDPFLSLFSNSFPSQKQSGQFIRSESNSLSLEILPIPDSFAGDRWLPAKNLQIVERGIDENELVIAGKPITRHVMIVADGMLSNQLPTLEQTVPAGLKLYPESPHLNDKASRSGISSTMQQSLTLVATDAGSYTLPAMEIPWWNTETREQEVARLPAREISFMPNPSVAANTQNHNLVTESTAEENPPPQTPADPVKVEPEFPWLVTLLGLAWLLTMLAWWISSRSKKAVETRTQAEPVKTDRRQDELKEVVIRLTSAYQEQDTVSARSAWLAWAQLTWPDNPPNNLTRLAKRCNLQIASAVEALERALYSPTLESGWSDYPVAQLIEESSSESPRRSTNEESMLVPLNP
ncbi:MAG: BatD family protein [Candidatus Thiodiazotropha sp. 6PLUC2]